MSQLRNNQLKYFLISRGEESVGRAGGVTGSCLIEILYQELTISQLCVVQSGPVVHQYFLCTELHCVLGI